MEELSSRKRSAHLKPAMILVRNMISPLDTHDNHHSRISKYQISYVPSLLKIAFSKGGLLFCAIQLAYPPLEGMLLGQPLSSCWYWCVDQTMVQRVLSAKGLEFLGF